jgi:hypothetical protein
MSSASSGKNDQPSRGKVAKISIERDERHSVIDA